MSRFYPVRRRYDKKTKPGSGCLTEFSSISGLISHVLGGRAVSSVLFPDCSDFLILNLPSVPASSPRMHVSVLLFAAASAVLPKVHAARGRTLTSWDW